ncbi:MAG: response regulator transcription factor [Sphingobacteriaceae bacterium]|nr:response regulator transcription factor [Sphingobacteriaceae bacterium]
MNILIADDHAIVRRGLIELLREEFLNAAITEAGSSYEVLEKVKGKVWDIIVLDISMPGRNGVEVLKQLRIDGIKAPVLMLSVHPEEQYAIRVLKAGASGFLNKDSATEELIAAVRRLLSGKKYITESLAEKLASSSFENSEKPLHEILSDREMQVFQLIASGCSVSEIADKIFLSVNTISTYRSRVLEKLGLSNNVEITRYAIEKGLI